MATNPTYGTFTATLPIRTDTFNFASDFNYSVQIQQLYEAHLQIKALQNHMEVLNEKIHTLKTNLPKQIVELYEQNLTFEALKQ